MPTAPTPPPTAPLPRPKATKPIFGKNAFSVMSVIAAFILAFILLAAFAVAKTGVIEVPLFSYFYHGPLPTRDVQGTPMSAEAFRVLVSSRLLAQAAEGKKPPYDIRASESEMTGGLDAVIDYALRDEVWKANEVQVAVTRDYLEFYGRFTHVNIHADTRIRLMPIVEKGGLRFEATDIRFGDYPVHPDIARYVAGLVFKRDMGTWVLSFGEATLQHVILRDGIVEIIAHPST